MRQLNQADSMTDADKSAACLRCLACCKVIALPLFPGISHEFYRDTRGIELKTILGVTWAVLPNSCQHLTEKGCAIYQTRPQECRDFDGRENPFVQDKCQWPKE